MGNQKKSVRLKPGKGSCHLTFLLAAIPMAMSATACAPQQPPQNARVTLELQQSESTSPLESQDYSLTPFGISPSGITISSAPSETTGFNCLAANIVGTGIQAPANFKDDSTSIDTKISHLLSDPAYFCSYPGITSPPLKTGGSSGSQTVELSVPTGKSRIIQMVGITDPDSRICNASATLGEIVNGGDDPSVTYYELGRVIQDVFSDATVGVPNIWNTLTGNTAEQEKRAMKCGGSNTGGSLPGTPVGPIRATYACNYTSATPPSPAVNSANTAIGSAYQMDDSTYVPTECYVASGFQTYVDYEIDVTNVDFTPYRAISVMWKGTAGLYSGSCNGSGLTTPHSLSSTGGAVVQFYDHSAATPTWVNVGTPSTTTANLYVSKEITPTNGLANAALPDLNVPPQAKRFIVRVAGGTPASGTSCSGIYTDFMMLYLVK